MSSVELPDGRKYEFKYNSYGELAEIQLPTGGKIQYVWQSTSGLYIIGGGPEGGNSYKVYRRVEKRRVYEGGVLQNETVYSSPSSQDTFVTVETYQNNNGTLVLANKIKHHYADSPVPVYSPLRPTDDPFWLSGRELQTEIYDSSGTLLRKTVNSWEPGTPLAANPNAPINARLAEITETLSDAGKVKKIKFGYDQFNNQTDVWEYDYGDGQAGSLLRRSHTHFLTTNPVNNIDYTATNVHLKNLPEHGWVSTDYNGTNKVSQVEYKYDETPLAARSNVIGWADPQNAARGNVTKTRSWSKYAGEAESWIETTAKYDVLGNVVETTDANQNVSTIDYADRFGVADANLNTSADIARAGEISQLLAGKQTFAFPTSVTNPSPFSWTAISQFDYYSGAAINAQDANGIISKTLYNDLLDRPTQMVAAIGTPQERQTTIAYRDDLTDRKVTTTSDLRALNDNLLKSESFYDGLGRTTEARKYEADGGYIATQTQYDALGRAYKVSNPFRSTEITAQNPIRWTESKFDALSRVIEVKTIDEAKVSTAYHGNRVLVTDQAGKQRLSETNAIGQLKKVWEVTAQDADTVAISFPNHPQVQFGYETGYGYDALSNLTTVNQSSTQGSQVRSFSYDSLSRLKTATNPELGTSPTNGTITYSYDANGNLKTKIDSRGIKTIYDYDALHRVIKRCYTEPNMAASATSCGQVQPSELNLNTPSVNYTYDAIDGNPSAQYVKGKMTKVVSSVSETRYTAFDALGRIKSSQQITNGQTFDFADYTYDLAGNLVSQKYPSGRVVKQIYDADGDLSTVSSRAGLDVGAYRNYAGQFAYTAHGAVSAMRLGNNRWESTAFNRRLQPTQIGLGTSATDTSIWKVEYGYYSGAQAAQNNGNVMSQTISAPHATSGQPAVVFNQTYTYDSLNRLKSADEKPQGYTPTLCDQNPNQCWKQTYKYDRFGNRTFDAASGQTTVPDIAQGLAKVINPEIDVANNRLKQIQYGESNVYLYDAAGNLTTDAEGKRFHYDAENKQVKFFAAGNAGNTPDGVYVYDGDGRRVKKTVTVSNQENTIFVYDAFGKLAAEYNVTPQSNQTAATKYLTHDTLGSPRVVTKQDGTVESRRDFLPFGEDLSTPQRTAQLGYVADNIRQGFTGYLDDEESGLDYAQARYYAPHWGRYNSVDPMPIKKKHLLDPRDFNRYVYVANNPFRYFDPQGLEKIEVIIRTFIPQKEVAGGFRGDGRGAGEKGTFRTEQKIIIETMRRSSFSAQKTVSPPSIFNSQFSFKFQRAFVA